MRLLTTISDVVFQGLTTRFFGLAGNGYLNMALRIVDPLRGVTGSMGHNIAMSFFVRVQDAPEKLRASVEQTMASTSLLLFPLFIGVAASGPTIIEVLAGPEWHRSGPLVVCLALAAAITSATNFLQGAVSAKGRADVSFVVTLLEFLLMVVALVSLSPWGLIAVGLARLASYGGEAMFNILAARAVLSLRARRTLAIVTPVLISAGIMGLSVFAIGAMMQALGLHAALRLGIQIATGAVVYILLAGVFHRAGLRSIYLRLGSRPPNKAH